MKGNFCFLQVVVLPDLVGLEERRNAGQGEGRGCFFEAGEDSKSKEVELGANFRVKNGVYIS